MLWDEPIVDIGTESTSNDYKENGIKIDNGKYRSESS